MDLYDKSCFSNYPSYPSTGFQNVYHHPNISQSKLTSENFSQIKMYSVINHSKF